MPPMEGGWEPAGSAAGRLIARPASDRAGLGTRQRGDEGAMMLVLLLGEALASG